MFPDTCGSPPPSVCCTCKGWGAGREDSPPATAGLMVWWPQPAFTKLGLAAGPPEQRHISSTCHQEADILIGTNPRGSDAPGAAPVPAQEQREQRWRSSSAASCCHPSCTSHTARMAGQGAQGAGPVGGREQTSRVNAPKKIPSWGSAGVRLTQMAPGQRIKMCKPRS